MLVAGGILFLCSVTLLRMRGRPLANSLKTVSRLLPADRTEGRYREFFVSLHIMRKIAFICLAILAVNCFHKGGKEPVTPEPAADTLQLAPDTTLIIGEAPAEEILDEAGNVATEPVVAEIPSPKGTDPILIGGSVEFDKVVHDFGDIAERDGPQTCTFKVRNAGKDPLAIYEVVTSCGCTDATWTKEPLLPGKTGKITVTYKNEDGPYPFDKTLTVYLSALNKPVILRIRGIVHEKKQSLDENFGTVRAGALGLKEKELNAGNMDQGQQRSDQVYIANLGRTPVTVSFKDVSDGLSLSVSPNPVPGRSKATLTFTVKASREKWGKNYYTAVPVVDGKAYPAATLSVRSVTKENFSALSDEERENGSIPFFDESTVSYGTVQEGEKVTGTFKFVNKGKSPFICHKADTETPGVVITPPAEVPPGGRGSLTVTFDTAGLPPGDHDVYMTLITNSPARPLISLFLIGSIVAAP